MNREPLLLTYQPEEPIEEPEQASQFDSETWPKRLEELIRFTISDEVLD